MASSNDTEDSFLHAIFNNPDDQSPRADYANWLEQRGDPRGEYLQLLLKFHGHHHYRWAGEYQYGVNERLAELGPGLDPKWVAVFDYFNCRIRETRTIRLRVPTSPAPKSYGPGLCKADTYDAALLVICGGWKVKEQPDRRRASWWLLRPPAGQPTKNPILTVEVPTDPEIERMALIYHRRGELRAEPFGPWTIQYQPRQWTCLSDPPRRGSLFVFGACAPWRVELAWQDGEYKPPRWSRQEGNQV
jgi:uncharacterized protein (TIGR02996 family)